MAVYVPGPHAGNIREFLGYILCIHRYLTRPYYVYFDTYLEYFGMEAPPQPTGYGTMTVIRCSSGDKLYFKLAHAV